jgi:hypothetical protein
VFLIHPKILLRRPLPSRFRLPFSTAHNLVILSEVRNTQSKDPRVL